MADFDDDLALLASELNRTAPIPVADFAMAPRAMETWLSALRSSGAQELLIVPGAPPTARDQDTLTPLTALPVDGLEVEGLVLPLLALRHVDAYRRGQTVDSAFVAPGLGRFRLHLHRGRGRAAATIHALPLDIPTLDALGATHDLSVLCTLTQIGRAHV